MRAVGVCESSRSALIIQYFLLSCSSDFKLARPGFTSGLRLGAGSTLSWNGGLVAGYLRTWYLFAWILRCAAQLHEAETMRGELLKPNGPGTTLADVAQRAERVSRPRLPSSYAIVHWLRPPAPLANAFRPPVEWNSVICTNRGGAHLARRADQGSRPPRTQSG